MYSSAAMNERGGLGRASVPTAAMVHHNGCQIDLCIRDVREKTHSAHI